MLEYVRPAWDPSLDQERRRPAGRRGPAKAMLCLGGMAGALVLFAGALFVVGLLLVAYGRGAIALPLLLIGLPLPALLGTVGWGLFGDACGWLRALLPSLDRRAQRV